MVEGKAVGAERSGGTLVAATEDALRVEAASSPAVGATLRFEVTPPGQEPTQVYGQVTSLGEGQLEVALTSSSESLRRWIDGA